MPDHPCGFDWQLDELREVWTRIEDCFCLGVTRFQSLSRLIEPPVKRIQTLAAHKDGEIRGQIEKAATM
jgi:hypothetical protein